MTTSSSSRKAPHLGVLELPELTPVLEAAGITVITGPKFRDAALAVKAAMATHGAFPLIVGDVPTNGLATWVRAVYDHAARSNQTIPVAVVRNQALPIVAGDHVTDLPTRFTVDELLTVLGLDPIGGHAGALTYPAAAEEPVGLELPDVFDELEPQPVPVPAAVDPFAFDEAGEDTPAAAAPAPVPEFEIVDDWAEPSPALPTPAASAPVAPVEPTRDQMFDLIRAGEVTPDEAAAHHVRTRVATAETAPTPAPPTAFTPAPAATTAPTAANLGLGIDTDVTDLFDEMAAAQEAGTGRSEYGDAAVIFAVAGKGGVGKTTFSQQLAQAAAEKGLRVILIDGNLGQGDQRTFLRIQKTTLPTIYDAALGPIDRVILSPRVINEHRSPDMGEVAFAFVGAPTDTINDATLVTPMLYRKVIEHSRRRADLVVVDTQIIENIDQTGFLSHVILPGLLQPGGWVLGLTEMSNAGANNLLDRLKRLVADGVPADRVMVAVNAVDPAQGQVDNSLRKMFSRFTYLGLAWQDPGVEAAMNSGRLTLGNPGITTIVTRALHRVTGMDQFATSGDTGQAPTAPGTATTGKRARTSLVGRIFGKKAA
ncbi:AAA family ATPase [Tersicoccus sp. MR15.9]|uniref:nucleotide-binding protein n=1 Tax=Tersicoccus mangrovi TaxID=3121635 RepID=UPI002FE519FF